MRRQRINSIHVFFVVFAAIPAGQCHHIRPLLLCLNPLPVVSYRNVDPEVNAAPNASVVRVIWHAQTNQIMCSTSAGGVRVMYDPAISDKGAMLSSTRAHSRLSTNVFLPKHAVSARLIFPCVYFHLCLLFGRTVCIRSIEHRTICCLHMG